MTFNLPDMKGIYDHLIVHCTATPASLDGNSSMVDRWHRAKGWSKGNGYNIIILLDGSVEMHQTGHRCRPFGVPGAHVGGCGPGWNARSLGISMFGGVKEDGVTPEDNFTDAQYATLWLLIQECWEAFGIPEANTIGHRDLIKMTNAAPKACPCFSVQAWIEAQHKNSTGQQTTAEHELERFDLIRLIFNWIRGTRPALPRGDKLKVPKIYTVEAGDTLWSISKTYGVPVSELKKSTGGSSAIQPGDKLRLIN